MRVQNTIAVISVSLLLLALAGCPNNKTSNTATAPPASSLPKASGTPGPASEAAEAAAVKEASGEDSAAPAATDSTGSAEPASASDPVLDKSKIDGEWFALFASQLGGPAKYAYANGHTLNFKPDGTAIWTLRMAGGPAATLNARYSVEGSKLILSFKSSALSSNKEFASQTPLGYGRDSEIGLSAGRDKEIGLKDGLGQDNSGKEEDMTLSFVNTGDFLSVSDEHNHLTVYGRVENPGTAVASQTSGDWEGHMSPEDRLQANFVVSGDKVSATIDNGKITFSGVVTQGYYVGDLLSPEGKSLAALLPESKTLLNGVYMPEPYKELKMILGFKRLLR